LCSVLGLLPQHRSHVSTSQGPGQNNTNTREQLIEAISYIQSPSIHMQIVRYTFFMSFTEGLAPLTIGLVHGTKQHIRTVTR
jgi:hypothetical protein